MVLYGFVKSFIVVQKKLGWTLDHLIQATDQALDQEGHDRFGWACHKNWVWRPLKNILKQVEVL